MKNSKINCLKGFRCGEFAVWRRTAAVSAAVLGLGLVDVPIRYRDRTFGTTQIRRFRHGLDLLRMTVVGLLRIKATRL